MRSTWRRDAVLVHIGFAIQQPSTTVSSCVQTGVRRTSHSGACDQRELGGPNSERSCPVWRPRPDESIRVTNEWIAEHQPDEPVRSPRKLEDVETQEKHQSARSTFDDIDADGDSSEA